MRNKCEFYNYDKLFTSDQLNSHQIRFHIITHGIQFLLARLRFSQIKNGQTAIIRSGNQIDQILGNREICDRLQMFMHSVNGFPLSQIPNLIIKCFTFISPSSSPEIRSSSVRNFRVLMGSLIWAKVPVGCYHVVRQDAGGVYDSDRTVFGATGHY
jgi:hypothetical protein